MSVKINYINQIDNFNLFKSFLCYIVLPLGLRYLYKLTQGVEVLKKTFYSVRWAKLGGNGIFCNSGNFIGRLKARRKRTKKPGRLPKATGVGKRVINSRLGKAENC